MYLRLKETHKAVPVKKVSQSSITIDLELKYFYEIKNF